MLQRSGEIEADVGISGHQRLRTRQHGDRFPGLSLQRQHMPQQMERRGVLGAVCDRLGVKPSVKNFLLFLIDQRRLIDFEAIREEYARLADEAAGRMQAEIVSASDLQEAQRERLTNALARRTGRQIELVVKVDPELIGGVIAKVGGVVFDGSLRTQLSQLHDSLTKG